MLVSISATHQNTSFETLEKLSTIGAGNSAALAGAHDAVRGVVVVSTCNRFEAYLDMADEDESESRVPAVSAVIHRIAQLSGLPPRQLRESVEFVHGNAVVRHLFSVASGLKSVALGEDEIAGQVRRALESSRTGGTTTSDLERLFQRATEASREVRSASNVSGAGRSIVRLALQLASSRVADWEIARVLLVGTGRYAAASLAAIRDLGVRDVLMFSLSGRGHRFAAGHGVPLVSREAYETEVALADVIVACTTSTGFALTRETLRRGRENIVALRGTRATGRQVVIDLGLPRNIDPDVANLSGVDLLDLETIRVHAPIDELTNLAHAREIVDAAAHRFVTSSRSHDISPSVAAVRTYIREVVEEEVSRLRSLDKLDAAGEKALLHLGSILMHRLTVQGLQLAASGDAQKWVDGVESILGVRPAPHRTGTRPPQSG